MGIIPSACTKMYKASFLRENNLLFDELHRKLQDYWFNLHAFRKAQNCVPSDCSGFVYKV
jgi:hypothetical protein